MSSELLLAVGKSYLFVFAAILPILNPAATAPIFLGLTEGASPSTGTVVSTSRKPNAAAVAASAASSRGRSNRIRR